MATYRERAWEIAVGRHGYVTTREAGEYGIPAIELVKLAARGRLRHVAHGIYRFDELPATEMATFYEAVLRVGGNAHLTGDAVLALHNLANVNPKRIRVAIDRRVRRFIPEWIHVASSSVKPEDVTMFEGIRSTTVFRAVLDSRPYVMRERLIDAATEATHRGLITNVDFELLAIALREPVV